MAADLPKFDIRDAIVSMQDYVRTYAGPEPARAFWQNYGRETFFEDMLFGIAIALGYETSAQGADAFKAELRERLERHAAELQKAKAAARNTRTPTTPEAGV